MSSTPTAEKKILASIYLESLAQNANFLVDISFLDMIDSLDRKKMLDSLESQELVSRKATSYSLTEKGRREIIVVMAGGAFDIIHPGHVETLEKSKALGDVLVVSIARDSTFEKNKKRKPLHSEELRQKLVLALKSVDAAVLGSTGDILETVEILKPDIIALGYDQSHSEGKIVEGSRVRGVNVKVVRLDSTVPSIKTTKILQEKS